MHPTMRVISPPTFAGVHQPPRLVRFLLLAFQREFLRRTLAAGDRALHRDLIALQRAAPLERDLSAAPLLHRLELERALLDGAVGDGDVAAAARRRTGELGALSLEVQRDRLRPSSTLNFAGPFAINAL